MIDWAVAQGWKVCLYTNRRSLLVQHEQVMEKLGVSFGVRAAGHLQELWRQVQICSIDTERIRVLKNKSWDLHNAQLVIWDEGHNHTSATARQLRESFRLSGAVQLDFTATPVGLGGLVDELVVAGTNTELRACGAHVKAVHYAPDEPDLHHAKRTKVGEFVQGDVVKAIMVPTIFGRVYQHWAKLNPYGGPTILFAPGVSESRWFRDEFRKRGVTAEHIDAKTPMEERLQIFDACRSGDVQVICNRFVMREGLDLPFLCHAILATAFGTLSTYLQSGGRVIRGYPGLDQVVVQDHGGNCHRFGSLNQDRKWKIGDTDESIRKAVQKQREKGEKSDIPEPITCPKCGGCRAYGDTCIFCGHKHKKSCRYVVQIDGTLKQQFGNTVKVKKEKPQEQKDWDNCFYAALNSRKEMTMSQVVAMYRQKTGKNLGHTSWNTPNGWLELQMSAKDFQQKRRNRG